MEHVRRTLFASGNLTQPYHSPNTDINKRIRYLEPLADIQAEPVELKMQGG